MEIVPVKVTCPSSDWTIVGSANGLAQADRDKRIKNARHLPRTNIFSTPG